MSDAGNSLCCSLDERHFLVVQGDYACRLMSSPLSTLCGRNSIVTTSWLRLRHSHSTVGGGCLNAASGPCVSQLASVRSIVPLCPSRMGDAVYSSCCTLALRDCPWCKVIMRAQTYAFTVANGVRSKRYCRDVVRAFPPQRLDGRWRLQQRSNLVVSNSVRQCVFYCAGVYATAPGLNMMTHVCCLQMSSSLRQQRFKCCRRL